MASERLCSIKGNTAFAAFEGARGIVRLLDPFLELSLLVLSLLRHSFHNKVENIILFLFESAEVFQFNRFFLFLRHFMIEEALLIGDE
mmetsp:Transcript_28728/g.27703  ORF Transcript_28728/g.27703 Transcript_28728/m.27703 type:complete len:88 (-) Transcript_28728:101-364(-)